MKHLLLLLAPLSPAFCAPEKTNILLSLVADLQPAIDPFGDKKAIPEPNSPQLDLS